jgi:beta-glucanase (GH16 family)
MPQIIEDRVREVSSSTGTGNIVLSGALTGFRSFSSVCQLNDTVYCAIVAVDASNVPTGQWEVGNYTYVAANTLARTTILSSSNANVAVSFSSGTKHVFLDLPAYQIKQFSTGGQTNPSDVWPVGRDQNLFNALTFQDEFNGSQLDATKWRNTLWYERTLSRPINYSVENGALHVWPQVDSTQTDNGNNGFYERMLATDGKWSQQYGYFEFRARMPRGKGLAPAFWLFNHQRSEGTIHTEIDVMECYTSADPVSRPGWSTSDMRPQDYVVTVWNNQITGDRAGTAIRMNDNAGLPLVDLNAAPHTFACHWDSTGMQFYFDGIAVGTKRVPNSNFVDRPMYIVLALLLGGESGTPNTSQTPQGISNAMVVDYVRAWSLKNP